MDPASNSHPASISQQDFEKFLHLLIHEIRNRLNVIALEAADLSEQAGPHLDGIRLQQQVRDCSGFLKSVREALASDDAEMIKKDPLAFMEELCQEKQ